MGNEAFFMEQMILIGATGRNRGKTVLAEGLIRLFKDRFPIIGLKVTTVAYSGAPCHCGDLGCGLCSSLSSYALDEERAPDPNSPDCMGKDTARMLQAGAERVYWLRSVKASMVEGFSEFLKRMPPSALVIGESNSLREVVWPGCFIMVSNGPGEYIKPSAARVADLAQLTLTSPITGDMLQRLMRRIIVDRTANGQVRVKFAG
ncbi:MAG: hypothetical protein LBP74_00905 [Treponema sp.]|jgi:hypothetical protein|nr:hypothetical protein [Treponema sp.]